MEHFADPIEKRNRGMSSQSTSASTGASQPSPASGFGRGVHCLVVRGWLQLSHAPSHALSQQTPFAQKPLAHSSFTEHGMVTLFEHDPLVQGIPSSHCVSLAQALKQLPVAGLHAKGEQDIFGPVTHAPMPLQTEAGVRTPSEHEPAAQAVPPGYKSQLPVPSHSPVCPQVDAMSLRQIPCGSGAPAATGAHIPMLPTRPQLSHGPLHATLQQIPSTQKPLVQLSPREHGMVILGRHDPFVQRIPSMHCASLVQAMKHVPEAGLHA